MIKRTRLEFRFLGGAGGDPCLLVDLLGERRAMLIDIGESPGLSAAIARRTTDLLITHTHLDHFSGFSRLLRHVLDQPRTIRVFGPAGIADNLGGMLSAYTWNYPDGVGINFEVTEIGEAGPTRRVCFRGVSCFRAEPLELSQLEDPGLLFADGLITARTCVLDHGIPVLAFSIEEAPFFNVDPEGLEAGPWLAELKRQAALPEDQRLDEIDTPDGPQQTGALIERLVTRTPGCKIAYVTDTLYTEQVAQRVAVLARRADIFFCEHMFAEAEAQMAQHKKHLTTMQVGLLAARAQVGEIRPFHFSRRYLEDPSPLVEEARRAWEAARSDLT